jgi:hypothetical protein
MSSPLFPIGFFDGLWGVYGACPSLRSSNIHTVVGILVDATESNLNRMLSLFKDADPAAKRDPAK